MIFGTDREDIIKLTINSMNNFYLGVIIISISGFFVIYNIVFRPNVYQILKKENIDCGKNIERFSDYIKVYLVLKNNRNLNNYERNILKQHIITTVIPIILYFIFVYIMFFTEW